jgi:hypothetical protein
MELTKGQKISMALTGKKLSDDHKEKIRKITLERIKNGFGFQKGYKPTKTHLKRLSDSHKGQVAVNKGQKGVYKMTPEWCINNSLKHKGEKSGMWKGGITPKNVKIRNSIESEIWRNGVFARDGYTCQKYGIKGGKLIAHHILNFSSYPELRFAIDNGITLSEKAHKEFHKKYGYRNNTKEQLLEFLN